MRAASIIDYIPEGKENAITRDRLCAVTGLPDRKLREEIEQARRRGEKSQSEPEQSGVMRQSRSQARQERE